jgi:tetratricopeptide (TPR) repeat protein
MDAPQDNSARTFRRAFSLVPTDDEQRREQIAHLAEGLKAAVAQADGKQQVNLSLQGRTPDYNSPSALTQNRTTAPKAVYDPRIVGNDMGLWVMGRTWLGFVEEAQEDLRETPSCPADNTCDLLRGLAGLALGNAPAAHHYFEQAAGQDTQDVLALLGLGTAQIIADDDQQALAFYRQALEKDPHNKVAAKNLKVLAD